MKKFDDYVLDSLVGDRELLKTYLTELDNEHTQQLAKEKMELVEELKETISICSDCNAEGVSQMVNVHFNILIQSLKSEEKEEVGG